MTNLPIILSAVVAIVAIGSATVALCLGHIQTSDYTAIVTAFGGVSIGVGAHAAGASSKG